MNIHLRALGCRLNEAELESWALEFQQAGHQLVPDARDADVTVVNTCAVTREAVRKSRKLINRLRRESPYGKLVVTGCAVSTGETSQASDLGIDMLVDNSQKTELVKTVSDTLPISIMPQGATLPAESALFARNRQRAFIKIQDGCRYRCTYCIVTMARGEEQSRTVQEIIDEVNQLHSQGIQEVVLTGVHVGGYGSDISSNLTDLVREILSSTDVPRIRFASVEPWDLGENFFSLFDNPRLMPHMHLPLQSGSDAVLRRMARRCKTSEFAHLIRQARTEVPGFNVTTDIIVGFPGETEQYWQETLEFTEATGFGHIHVFSYSPRAGTKAAGMQDQIDESVKKHRSAEMRELAQRLRHEFVSSQIGNTATVLWEGRPAESRPADAATSNTLNGGAAVTLENNSQVFGYTENYTRVSIDADQAPKVGGIAPCTLESVEPQGRYAYCKRLGST